MSYEDLPCEQFVEFVTDYLEGALDPERKVVFEWHLAFCEPCVDYMSQYRSAVAAAAELGADEADVPDPVMGRLLDAFRSASEGRSPPAG